MPVCFGKGNETVGLVECGKLSGQGNSLERAVLLCAVRCVSSFVRYALVRPLCGDPTAISVSSLQQVAWREVATDAALLSRVR